MACQAPARRRQGAFHSRCGFSLNLCRPMGDGWSTRPDASSGAIRSARLGVAVLTVSLFGETGLDINDMLAHGPIGEPAVALPNRIEDLAMAGQDVAQRVHR